MKSTRYHVASKKVTIAMIVLLAATGSLHAQELVKNGAFLNNYANWEFKASPDYLKDAPKPKIDARGEGVLVAGLFADHHHPANAVELKQKVAIELGRRYRLTFEVKGEGGDSRYGRLTCIVHAPLWGASWSLLGGRQCHLQKQIDVTSEWQKVSEEFTGRFGPNDFNEMKQTMRDGIKNHPEWDAEKKKRETNMIHWNVNFTNLEFWYAKGRGDIRVRNVSLQLIP